MRASYDRFLLAQLLLSAFASTSNAFVVTTTPSRAVATNRRSLVASTSTTRISVSAAQSSNDVLESIADVTLSVNVNKPMGVIFGENPQPFSGLGLDDVSPGLNGGAAGLRVGDQLVAVNDQVVVGRDFDTVMELLQTSPDPVSLNLFRGPPSDLYTIIDNRGADPFAEDELDEEALVMDESYEAPRVDFGELKDEEPLSAGDVFNIFKKIGSEAISDVKDAASSSSSSSSGPKEEQQEKKGLFGGMFGGGETIQLDGKDASSLGK